MLEENLFRKTQETIEYVVFKWIGQKPIILSLVIM